MWHKANVVIIFEMKVVLDIYVFDLIYSIILIHTLWNNFLSKELMSILNTQTQCHYLFVTNKFLQYKSSLVGFDNKKVNLHTMTLLEI